MSNVISVENLGKKYLISHQGREPYTALRDVLADGLRAVGRRLFSPGMRSAGTQAEEFWALKDVSFEVKQGERIGIIGRNGAGKSTLLKILSRITEPAKGCVRIKGRVASLLEVGTGFHPELTGRENIFLNGAILGMGRAEIARKFDEIVAFAEIERFLDTPVKRYSSGMYVRLAFSVAAHLDPEILLVDEVLAVGDAQFQKKCLGKMEDVSVREGRTVLFVSHNMGVIHSLCSTALVLDRGMVSMMGEAANVVSSYLASLTIGPSALLDSSDLVGRDFSVVSLILLNASDEETTSFSCDEAVRVRMHVNVRRSMPGLYGYVEILNSMGDKILVSDTYDMGYNMLEDLDVGEHVLEFQIPPRTLGHGDYVMTIDFSSPQSDRTVGNTISVEHLDRVIRFTLNDFTTRRGNTRKGFFSTIISWEQVL